MTGNPPRTLTISPNASNKNFEIVILFNIVERFGNYILNDDTPPTALRARVVSYALGVCKVYRERGFI
jgi:hypothetical protein